MISRWFLFLLLLFILVPLFAPSLPAFAGEGDCPTGPHIKNPLTGDCKPLQPFEIYARIIRVFLTLIGSISLVFCLYGGFLWLTSAGNSEKIEQGRNTLLWAILGVATALLSYAVLNFIIGSVLPS